MQPLRFGIVPPGSAEAWLFHGLLAHEQSARTSATWVRDRHGRPVACALFGATVQ